MAATQLLSVARASGRCPPSLIGEDRIINGGAFELTLSRALDSNNGEWRLVVSPDGRRGGLVVLSLTEVVGRWYSLVNTGRRRRDRWLVLRGDSTEGKSRPHTHHIPMNWATGVLLHV
eukprot:scaffold4185_cov163-Alexandrium_tamarense.AAC.8